MPQFQRLGASIHYEVLGDGPPLLLIAGIASDGASWGPLIPLLQNAFRLILIDNRGSGQSRVEGEIEIRDMVDDCAALLEHLGPGPVEVVGHSLGGMLGLMLAASYPQKVRRLVTMTTGRIPPSKRALFHDMSRLYFAIAPEDWFRLLYQWLFSDAFFADEANVASAAAGSAGYRFRQSPGDFARQVAAVDRIGRVDLSVVACPVLALAAELDLLSPPWAVEALHKAMPAVTHKLIGGVAHSIHWEAPEPVAREIIEFLNRR